MKRLIIIYLLGLVPYVSAQQIQFYRTYGEGVYNSGQAVLQTSDSGYVVCGGINEFDDNAMNVLLFQTDSLGVQQWRKSIGGSGIDFAKHFTYSPGGNGYLMVGYTNRNGSYDGLLIATDLNGDTLWTKTYGGSDWDMLYSVDTTYDGAYIVAGETYSMGAGNSDAWIMKLNTNGDTIWTKTIGGTNVDNARWVFEDRDSNLVVVGSTESFGAGMSDVYVVYMNGIGDTLWTFTQGTAGNEYGYSGDEFFDGGNNLSLMIGGSIEHVAEGFTTYYHTRVATDGSYIYHTSASLSNVYDLLLPRIRNEGGQGKFYVSYQGQAPGQEFNAQFHRTFYNAIFGYTVQSVFATGGDVLPYDILKTYDLGYIMVGEVKSAGPNVTSAFLVKMDSVGNHPATVVLSNEEQEINGSVNIYPNPFHEQITISGLPEQGGVTLEWLDILGKTIYTTLIPGGGATVQTSVTDIAPGQYFLRIRHSKGTTVKKIIRY